MEETEQIEARNIPVVWAKDIYSDSDGRDCAIASISTEKVFITIEVDSLDASLMPVVGTP